MGSDLDNAQALRDSRQQLQMLMSDDAFDEFEEVFSAAHIQQVPGYERWTPHKGRLGLAELAIAQLHLDAGSDTQPAATATSLLRAFARSASSHCDQLPRSLAGSGAFFSPVLDAVVSPGQGGAPPKHIAAPSVGVIHVTRDTDPPTFLSSLVQPARPSATPTHEGSTGPATAAAATQDPDDIPFVDAVPAASRHQVRGSRRSGRRSRAQKRSHQSERHRTRPEHKQEHRQLAVRFDAKSDESDHASWCSGSSASASGGGSGDEGTLSDAAAEAPSGLSRVQRLHTPKAAAQHAPEKRAPVAFSVDMTGGGGGKKQGGGATSTKAGHSGQAKAYGQPPISSA